MRITSLIVALVLLLGTGCETVQPWERGILARDDMQLETDPLAGQLSEQVYASKEASSGGAGPAGAGCGCN